MSNPILPLSYGPDAVCLRSDGGNTTHCLSWDTLGRLVSHGFRTGGAITIHHQRVSGNYTITVDCEPKPIVYTPHQFRQLFEQNGTVTRVN